MKNSVFLPIYRIEVVTPYASEESVISLLREKSFGIFSFSVLKSDKFKVAISFNLILVPLLYLVLSNFHNKQQKTMIKIRFSNILLFVFILQLTIAFLIGILAIFYIQSNIGQKFFMIFPILIYFIGIMNFHCLKNQVLKKLQKFEVLIS